LFVIVDQHGMAFGACCHPGNRPDVTLLGDTLQSSLVALDRVPLLADRGYDSRSNRGVCRDYGLSDRIFRRRTKTVRRTNARRIVVEHSFAWLDQFRRLLLCYEQQPAAYLAFVYVALGHLLCRRFLTSV
jgi:transposase